MNKIFLRLICIGITFLIINCGNKNDNSVVFVKEVPIKEDATKIYLHKAANYKNDKKYLSVFYKYYKQLLTAKKYTEAAQVLEIACIYLADSYDFNSTFMATVKNFDLLYRKKVPLLKTTFIDAYLANYYFDKSDLKSAAAYFTKITLNEPNNYNSCYNIGRAYYDLSYIHYITGKQNLSLIANQKAFEYFTKINNPKGLAFVYSNYANIYTAIGDKKRAVKNADLAIKMYKIIDNTYNVYIGLINKIAIYDYMNDNQKIVLIDSTFNAFTNSKQEEKILKLKIYEYKIENLVRTNNLIEAKKLIDELQPVVQQINSDDLTNEYKIVIAQYEIKKNANYSDFADIKKALPTLIINQQYEKVNMFYGVLQFSALQNNDYKTAYDIEKQKRIITDSIADISTREKIVELDAIYETQKKQQQIALQKTTILNKNTTIALLASLFLGLLLLVIVLITRQKQKKLKLEKQSAQLYTKQLLEKTEEERKRIASDLHDSVSHELLSLKNLFQEKTEITNNKIDAIINDIRIISRNLHPIMFDKIGLKESIIQMVDRTQLVNNFMVSADIECQTVMLSTTELQIYRIIQEALSNIIKYANAHAAKITIFEEKKTLFIEVKDNGTGFNVAEMLTGNKAFGLHNIIERSRAIGGESKIISDENGTTISIEIPL